MTRRVKGRAPAEIEAMRRAGRVVAAVHRAVADALAPGVTTAELDRIARSVLERHGARSSFLGYHGFPAVICTSVNDEVVHGIPGDRRLEAGDIISVDAGAIVDGWHGDAAATYPVGEVSGELRRLMEVGRRALQAGMAAAVPGARVGDIGAAVEAVATAAGYGVVRDYVGHGIGRAMHTWPDIPNHGPAGRGPVLCENATIAIEPMVCAGSGEVVETDDGWTVVTVDGSPAVHFEHTVVVRPGGARPLTVP